MPNQRWTQPLEPIEIADGGTNTTGAEALMFPDKTIPGGFFTEDRWLTGRARFRFSNAVTTPGSITFRLRWGGLTGTILAQSSAIALNIVVQNAIMGCVNFDIHCRARGATGSLLAMGDVILAQQLAASNNQPNFMGSAGGATGNTPVAVTVNTLADTLLSLTYQSTVATGSCTGMMYLPLLVN